MKNKIISESLGYCDQGDAVRKMHFRVGWNDGFKEDCMDSCQLSVASVC